MAPKAKNVKKAVIKKTVVKKTVTKKAAATPKTIKKTIIAKPAAKTVMNKRKPMPLPRIRVQTAEGLKRARLKALLKKQ